MSHLRKAIALKGRRRIGKSQTIRTVDELLREKYPSARVGHERRTRVDLRVVLGINGVRIGIESNSDPKSLDLFVRLGCNVIICATRTTGKTVAAVTALPGYEPGYEVAWLEQRAQSNLVQQVLGNLAMARDIVEEIEESITSAKPAVLRRAAGR